MALEEIKGNMEEALLRLLGETLGLRNLEPETIEANKAPIQQATIETLADLVSENTVSSTRLGQNRSTVERAERIGALFRELGIEDKDIKIIRTTTEESPLGVPQAGVVIKIAPEDWKAPEGESGIAMVGHLDTVEEGDRDYWMLDGERIDPFALTRVAQPDSKPIKGDDLLIGRGTSDMKGADASMLTVGALLAKRRNDLKKPLYLCFSWGEETWDKGINSVIAGLTEFKAKPEVILAPEPTGEDIIVTRHNGYLDMQFEITPPEKEAKGKPHQYKYVDAYDVGFHGKSAHSSDPSLGIDAIRHFLVFASGDLKKLREKYKDKGEFKICRIKADNEGSAVPVDLKFHIEIAGDKPSVKRQMFEDLQQAISVASQKMSDDKPRNGSPVGPNVMPPGVTWYKGHVKDVTHSPAVEEVFCGEVASKLLAFYDELKRQGKNRKGEFYQEGFDPNHATINFHSTRSKRNGGISFGISYRGIDPEVQSKVESDFKQFIGDAAKQSGCGFDSKTNSYLTGIPEQSANVQKHVKAIKQAITRSRSAEFPKGNVDAGTEPGYADTGALYRWAKEKGINSLLCQWFPFNVHGDWNKIHSTKEYARKETDLWAGFKGLLEIAREFTGLAIGRNLNVEAIRDGIMASK